MRDLQTNSICLTKVNVTSALARYIRFFSRSLRRKLLGFAPFVPHFAKLRLHSVSLRMTHSHTPGRGKRQRLPLHYPESWHRALPGKSGGFPLCEQCSRCVATTEVCTIIITHVCMYVNTYIRVYDIIRTINKMSFKKAAKRRIVLCTFTKELRICARIEI